MNYSDISKENEANGRSYQEEVAKYLESITGQPATINDHGIDIECGEFKVEVKGTRNLYKKPQSLSYHLVSSWKTEQKRCPDNITHFIFVLDELYLCNKPLIYVVDIKERFNEYPKAQWVIFPLWWVFNHLIYNLSRIPTGGK